MPSKDTQWRPGQSGNPGGKRKGIDALVREQIGDDTGIAILKVHAELAQGRIPEGIEIEKFSGRDMAASAAIVLDRLWGKPKQSVEFTNEPAHEAAVDWSAVPEDERRKLLEAAERIEQIAVTVNADEQVEH